MKKDIVKHMVNESRVVSYAKTMYERPEIEPYGAFCPNCGCSDYYSVQDVRVQYPEHYETFYCSDCDDVVGWIDNSPFRHVLEEILSNI